MTSELFTDHDGQSRFYRGGNPPSPHPAMSLFTHVNVQVVKGGHALEFGFLFTVDALVVERNFLVTLTKFQ